MISTPISTRLMSPRAMGACLSSMSYMAASHGYVTHAVSPLQGAQAALLFSVSVEAHVRSKGSSCKQERRSPVGIVSDRWVDCGSLKSTASQPHTHRPMITHTLPVREGADLDRSPLQE
jgi:hypothetical protein